MAILISIPSLVLWKGPASAFAAWRIRIGILAGYKTKPWVDGPDFLVPDLSDFEYGNAEAEGNWKETPDDPLLVLLAHSDWLGCIHPAQAGPLSERLTELLPLITDPTDREIAILFVAGLATAAQFGEVVTFEWSRNR